MDNQKISAGSSVYYPTETSRRVEDVFEGIELGFTDRLFKKAGYDLGSWATAFRMMTSLWERSLGQLSAVFPDNKSQIIYLASVLNDRDKFSSFIRMGWKSIYILIFGWTDFCRSPGTKLMRLCHPVSADEAGLLKQWWHIYVRVIFTVFASLSLKLGETSQPPTDRQCNRNRLSICLRWEMSGWKSSSHRINPHVEETIKKGCPNFWGTEYRWWFKRFWSGVSRNSSETLYWMRTSCFDSGNH